jgi:hypothetical protein
MKHKKVQQLHKEEDTYGIPKRPTYSPTYSHRRRVEETRGML